ncbi:MAG: hypothetical protein ACI91O_000586 [Candidatus Poriferisodalaceae bacterium]|jgi:hypothetical protein
MTADSAEDFLRALKPIVEALGATIVPVRSARPGDVPIEWSDQELGYVRVAELHGALDRLVANIERETGTRLPDMGRDQKQLAVRRLDEQGAFLLRGSVESVAAMMSVSKVTLYAYLNAISGRLSTP